MNLSIVGLLQLPKGLKSLRPTCKIQTFCRCGSCADVPQPLGEDGWYLAAGTIPLPSIHQFVFPACLSCALSWRMILPCYVAVSTCGWLQFDSDCMVIGKLEPRNRNCIFSPHTIGGRKVYARDPLRGALYLLHGESNLEVGKQDLCLTAVEAAPQKNFEFVVHAAFCQDYQKRLGGWLVGIASFDLVPIFQIGLYWVYTL